MINRLTRRGFFQVILGAMVAGTLLTCPRVADAIEQEPENKIAVAVRMTRDFLKIMKPEEYKSYIIDGCLAKAKEYEQQQKKLNEKIEQYRPMLAQIMDYLTTNFDDSTVSTAEVQTLLYWRLSQQTIILMKINWHK